MATVWNLPGGGTPAERLSYYLDDKNAYSSGVSLPYGNIMTNGGQVTKITHLRAWVSGRGSARGVQLGIGGYWTGVFTVGAAGSANDTGWIPYGVNHSPGGGHIFYINPASGGGIYFGRSANGTGSTGLVGGSGGWSGSLSGQILWVGSPSVTRNVTAVRNANGTITVSWTAPADDGGEAISLYYIGMSTNASFTQNVSQTNVGGHLRSWTFSGLAPGATYYFRVSSGNSLNASYGYGAAWSNVASAQSSAVPAIPGAPVVSKTSASTSMNFTWTVPANNGAAITNYELQWSGTADFASIVGSDTSPGNTKTLPGFALATKYFFRVRAINSIGPSAWSSVTSYPNVPTAPSSVGVASVNSTTLTASWNAPTSDGGDSITNYELQWSTSPTFSPGNSSNGNNTSRNVGSLTALTLYYFRVRATNGIGTSDWSAVKSFTTAETEPPPPPPAVTRGGRLKVNGAFIEPKVRVKDENGVWQEPISKTRQNNVWVDPV